MTGLGPAAILLSLSIWGVLFGIIGMIVALPLTTLMVSYYKNFAAKKEVKAETQGNPKQESKTKKRR